MKPITRKDLKRIARSSLTKAVPFLMTLVAANVVMANPAGFNVTNGNASVSNSGNTETITQTSQQAIINWSSFNINSNQTTTFVQPTGGTALNRISPNQGASQILGNLNSNGQIILFNPAGFYFSSGAVVNVGSIIATTSNISDANFLSGHYVFDSPSTFNNASIVNNGHITASDYGLVALLGSNVTNNGYIKANLGSVVLASGSTFTMDFNGDQLVNFAVTGATSNSNAGVTNNGSIVADGGKIELAAQVLVSAHGCQSVLDNAIDMEGVVQADSVSSKNGEIILASNQDVEVNGTVSAQGKTAGTSGGNIEIYGNNINLDNYANVVADGNVGGGNITMGQLTASGALTNANSINASYWSNVSADVTGGNYNVGGNVNLYANTQNLSGVITASGTVNGSLAIGGNIGLYGNNINMSYAYIDSSADFVGGTVNIGGNPQSTTSNTASNSVYVDSNTVIRAAVSGQNGFGGALTIAANTVNIMGHLDVSGAALGSSGGSMSISGTNITIGQVSQQNNYGCGGYSGGCGGCGGCGGAHYASNGALLDASGNLYGGEILLGSDPTFGLQTASVVVNQGSTLNASSTGNTNGSIGGYVRIYANNDTMNGTINVSAATAHSGALGGEAQIFAHNNISIGSSAQILATGDGGGGQVNIGGDLHGAGTDPDALNTTIASGAVINANAGTNGMGGFVTVWSNGTTTFNGTITARGGSQSGNGGEVEVAGGMHTVNHGSISVSAPHGASGTVLNN